MKATVWRTAKSEQPITLGRLQIEQSCREGDCEVAVRGALGGALVTLGLEQGSTKA
jgi:hypothetical protein